MAQHNEIGSYGELQAQHYLTQKGYKLLDCNWHYHKYELDIICEYNNMLIIVEVKTRSTTLFGHPYDAVTPKKIKHIVSASQAYIHQHHMNKEVRFDIISIVPDQYGKVVITHIIDAFLPPINTY